MTSKDFDGRIESLDDAIETGDIEAAIEDLVAAALASEGKAEHVKLVKQKLKDVIAMLDDGDFIEDDEEEEDEEEDTDDGEG